jgi:2,4-dienoyl-CoA reductase-like NADH-dependent reductase (Old Yellow Enzyme family)
VQAVGMIVDPHQAEKIVADGHADCVAFGRGFLDDPRWAWHAAAVLGADVVYPPQYLAAPAARRDSTSLMPRPSLRNSVL